MAVNFSSLLQVDASTVERPKPLPVGTYSCTIVDHEFGESRNNKTPFCRLNLKPIMPEGDVDMDAFNLAGGQEAMGKRKLAFDYWLTQDSLWRFREFFEKVLGIDVEGKMFDELCPQMNGQTVKAVIIHKPSQDNQTIVAYVDRLLQG